MDLIMDWIRDSIEQQNSVSSAEDHLMSRGLAKQYIGTDMCADLARMWLVGYSLPAPALGWQEVNYIKALDS